MCGACRNVHTPTFHVAKSPMFMRVGTLWHAWKPRQMRLRLMWEMWLSKGLECGGEGERATRSRSFRCKRRPNLGGRLGLNHFRSGVVVWTSRDGNSCRMSGICQTQLVLSAQCNVKQLVCQSTVPAYCA